jgi:hypothetical protein
MEAKLKELQSGKTFFIPHTAQNKDVANFNKLEIFM